MAKRGKRLGGKPPRRGGRLTGASRPHRPGPGITPIAVAVVGFLILGVVAGFGWGMDRQLRGGILAQQREARTRADWVELETLPPHVPRAFLTVIDPGFEEGAAVRTRDESKTIPRELVRQIHLLGDGLGSQARELAMAPVLEKRLTQRELLELYLNRIHLGDANGYPVYGLHYASLEYFDKQPQELTLSEAATLAGLLLEPRIPEPGDRAGAVGIRRNEVLRGLLREGHITAQQYEQAITERLAFQPGLADPPMTRQILTAEDTAVIRLPPEYRPQVQPEEESG